MEMHAQTVSPTKAKPLWVSKYVDAGNVRTHYLEAGNPANSTVILLHGGGAGADSIGNWQRTIPQFADEFHVIAMDMLGFGLTDKPESITYSQAARNQHLIDFLGALDLRRVPIIGNSMGGATALGVAMEKPELVDCLVLMGSAGLNAEISEALKPIVFYDYTMEGMEKLIKALTGKRFKVGQDLVKLRYELSIEPDTRRAYSATMAWIREQGGLAYPEEAIARVKTPALVVNGKDDLVVPMANAYKFLQLLENSWGYFIPHCGHWAMLEAPEEFATITRNFLHARAH